MFKTLSKLNIEQRTLKDERTKDDGGRRKTDCDDQQLITDYYNFKVWKAVVNYCTFNEFNYYTIFFYKNKKYRPTSRLNIWDH